MLQTRRRRTQYYYSTRISPQQCCLFTFHCAFVLDALIALSYCTLYYSSTISLSFAPSFLPSFLPSFIHSLTHSRWRSVHFMYTSAYICHSPSLSLQSSLCTVTVHSLHTTVHPTKTAAPQQLIPPIPLSDFHRSFAQRRGNSMRTPWYSQMRKYP